MGKIEREIFESFDRETRRLLNENSNGKNNEVLRERMKTRASMTYSHNLAMYYEQNPFGTELFYIDAWIDQNKNWLESSKIFIYYGASEVRSNKDYTQFTIKVNGGQKIVGRVDDYYVTHSRDDDENSLMRRKNYFQTLAYVQYLEQRRMELTQPQKLEPEPLDLSDTSTVEKSKPNKLKKSLVDFIQNVKDKEAFLQELKTTFTTEKGKSIKIIITLLKKESILIINSREFKDFHLELQSFFDRDIGTRQSVNDVIFDDIHPEIIDPIQKRLNPLVIKHKAI